MYIETILIHEFKLKLMS